MTPAEVATQLGVEPIQVRRFLREQYPRSEVEKGRRWTLTPDMVRAVRSHFATR